MKIIMTIDNLRELLKIYKNYIVIHNINIENEK